MDCDALHQQSVRGRLIPEHKDSPVYQKHRARYVFSCDFVRDKTVLDAACGTGYGSMMLLEDGHAAQVTGVDISTWATDYARENFAVSGLRFEVGNVKELRFPSESFDVVVSLETIEHLDDAVAFLHGVQRVLTHDGVLVVSTPNRRFFSPGRRRTKPLNPFHFQEWRPDEFDSLLRTVFQDVGLYGQVIESNPRRKALACWLRRRVVGPFVVAPGSRLLRGTRLEELGRGAYRTFFERFMNDYRGFRTSDTTSGEYDPDGLFECSRVKPIPKDGSEPHVIIAVCRHPVGPT